jgi:hypothetical protein
MKKYLLLASLTVVMAFIGYSQSLSLSDSTGQIANNSTIIKWGLPSADEIVTFLNVTNNTSHAIPVKVKKVEIDVAEGSMNLFCWGLCFAPSVYVSPDPLTINANSTNTTDFSGHYTPNGAVAISVIRYVFFNSDNPSDSVCVNVMNDTYPSGIANKVIKPALSNAFPNPANGFTHFDYSIPEGTKASMVMRNVIGSTVKEMTIQSGSGRLTINTSDLTEGVYFYSFLVNGDPLFTKKIVVKH